MPITAIDVDGLEPLTMIDNMGKLTSPVIALLSASLNYTADFHAKSIWDDYKNTDTGKNWFKLTNNPLASVCYETVFYDKGSLSNYSDKRWLSLIAHEESHNSPKDRSQHHPVEKRKVDSLLNKDYIQSEINNLEMTKGRLTEEKASIERDIYEEEH
jgi:hypothetical protein